MEDLAGNDLGVTAVAEEGFRVLSAMSPSRSGRESLLLSAPLSLSAGRRSSE